jgi:hypothetical protein
VQNIFSLRTEIGTSPLLGLRILTALHDAQHTEEMGKESFMAVSQLYDYFQTTTIERRVISLWLDAMLHTGLCWSYDPTQTDIEKVQKIELSPSGRQHLHWASGDESYLGSMMEVTPIAHQPTFDKMRAVPWENKTLEWLEKTVLFLDYLIDEDNEYVRIRNMPHTTASARLRKALNVSPAACMPNWKTDGPAAKDTTRAELARKRSRSVILTESSCEYPQAAQCQQATHKPPYFQKTVAASRKLRCTGWDVSGLTLTVLTAAGLSDARSQ